MSKINKPFILILTIAAVVSLFASCEMLTNLLETPNVLARIESFETALNASPRDVDDLTANFAPTPVTEMASQMSLAYFWDSKFDVDNKFSFEITDSLDFDAVTATMTETYTNPETDVVTTFETVEVTFKMYKDDDGVWLIEEYWEEGVDDAIIRTLGTK